MAYWHGNTSFIDNRSKTKGGGLVASDDTHVEFHGTTVAKGNYAGTEGGAFRIGGTTKIKTSLIFNGSTTIHNNSAGNLGGAISMNEKCDVSWDGNTTLSEN
ncbi:unnamed protein product, partial [Ascophyllum nodosum]